MSQASQGFLALHAALQVAKTHLAAERLTPDEYGLALAQSGSWRADCTRRQVGAVILNSAKRVVGTGYNGAPAGQPGCLSAGACPRGQATYDEIPKDLGYVDPGRPCIALHAEENALLHSARTDRAGATIYITDPPCPNCSRLLAGSGLARVVWFADGQIHVRELQP